MRIGKAPLRNQKERYKVRTVTCCVLTHIPHLVGYYSQRFQILRLCLTSMIENAGMDCNTLVIANNCCREVMDWLWEMQTEKFIDNILSTNETIGKLRALHWIFDIVQSPIIAYSDDDMFFFPEWLTASLDILEHFPHVGVVSAYPFRPQSQLEKLISATLEWGARYPNAEILRKRVIPDDWDEMSIMSVGRDYGKYREASKDTKDYVLMYDGKKALVQGHHCQFIGFRDTLRDVIRRKSDKLMGGMLQFDHDMNQMGLLRLTTYGGYAMHMGNVLSPSMVMTIREQGFKDANVGIIKKPPLGSWFIMKCTPLSRLLFSVYEWLYWALSRSN